MKKHLIVLASLLTLATGMVSCQAMKDFFVQPDIEAHATILSADSPTCVTFSGGGTVGGGSARTRISGTTTIWSQKVTIRRHDNNQVVTGTITLDSPNDRLYRGNSGYSLIGQRSGQLRGFERMESGEETYRIRGEETYRIRACVISAGSPVSDGRTWEQQITIRREDNKKQMSSVISLSSYRKRLYPRNRGYALVDSDGNVIGFDVTRK